jgi:hypothetical protein
MGSVRALTAVARAVAALAAARASAGITLSEAAVGDFSNDRFNPTRAVLAAGTNRISGLFGLSPIPDVHDLDYVTIRVEADHVLTSFRVASASVGGAFAFVAIQAGPILTIPADWTSIKSPLLGWAHFGTASVGADLLPDMGVSPGSVGFTAPLAAGEYALWIMELDASEPHSYTFELEVAAVPAPGALPILAAMVARGRRRRIG